jgi:RNA polymerase sigma factor (sigma-70 family)
MHSDDTTLTSPTLLKRTADWRDHDAWREFVARYQPYIRAWCREYRLDGEIAEDVCQLFWIEVADKLRSFRYDPGRRFRGWLRTLFHWRALNALQERSREGRVLRSLDDPSSVGLERSLLAADRRDEEGDEPGARWSPLVALAEEVQAAVREKVQPRSWQVFVHIDVDGWSTRETADALGLSYIATYKAHQRVVARLVEEGERRLARLNTPDTDPRLA